jgi:hypothetical protein
MRKLLLTTAAVLTLGSGTIIANAQPAGLSAEQTSAYKAWSDDQRVSYDTWPVDYRTYYWTLTPPRQSGWWLLTDEQRARIYAMAEADRAAALDRVQAEMSARAAAPPQQPVVVQTQANPQGAGVPSASAPNPATASDPVPPAQPADPSYQAGPYKGALTPPPAEAANKTYPVCTRAVRDNCQNRGEGGAPGRSRAIP